VTSHLQILQTIVQLARYAFRQARLEPRGGRYVRAGDGRLRCACAVGAIHIAFAINSETRERTFERLTGAGQKQRRDFELGFDSAFKHGFARATECYDDPAFIDGQSAWWLIGRQVGLAVRPRMTSPKETT